MATVYLIPSLLAEEGADAIPPYILDAIKNCQVFFVENERTTRRYFKRLWKEMVIDDYEWYVIAPDTFDSFKNKLNQNKTIGIVSEAGCPAVADPGQLLIAIAQQMNATIKPLVGPSSILLALMASGMNGQEFRFSGYLPIDNTQRVKEIRELEAESARKNCTQIFIETPYRNKQLLDALLTTCAVSTRLCVAVDLTGKEEWVKTRTVAEWKNNLPELHKRPAIFLLHAAS